MCKNMPPLELAIQFHGHICPGLLMGVRAAEFAQKYLNVDPDQDEELLAIAETNSCGVDAIQAILGCTFGKGNLIFKDYGKSVYTIASREQNRAVRMAQKYLAQPHPDNARYRELCRKDVLSGSEAEEKENLLAAIFERLMTAPFEDLFNWQEIDFSFPEKAQIYPTVQCSICGEGVMEPRAVLNGQLYVCPSCA